MSTAAAYSQTRPFSRSSYRNANRRNAVNTGFHGTFGRDNYRSRRIKDSVLLDGTSESGGIPLYVFNYLDYQIWIRYAENLRGEKKNRRSKERKNFFKKIGCSDFGMDVFDNFYFSRTRRSLEHYFPQANAGEKDDLPNEYEINCFGNYAMIGSEANSSGSNWSPKVKLDHYLDTSGKIRQVSVASLKFRIMMQICKDNEMKRETGKEWIFEDIKNHQMKMIEVLFE